jgi:ABC-type taurine transport system ATPase subunit
MIYDRHQIDPPYIKGANRGVLFQQNRLRDLIKELEMVQQQITTTQTRGLPKNVRKTRALKLKNAENLIKKEISDKKRIIGYIDVAICLNAEIIKVKQK